MKHCPFAIDRQRSWFARIADLLPPEDGDALNKIEMYLKYACDDLRIRWEQWNPSSAGAQLESNLERMSSCWLGRAGHFESEEEDDWPWSFFEVFEIAFREAIRMSIRSDNPTGELLAWAKIWIERGVAEVVCLFASEVPVSRMSDLRTGLLEFVDAAQANDAAAVMWDGILALDFRLRDLKAYLAHLEQTTEGDRRRVQLAQLYRVAGLHEEALATIRRALSLAPHYGGESEKGLELELLSEAGTPREQLLEDAWCFFRDRPGKIRYDVAATYMAQEEVRQYELEAMRLTEEEPRQFVGFVLRFQDYPALAAYVREHENLEPIKSALQSDLRRPALAVETSMTS